LDDATINAIASGAGTEAAANSAAASEPTIHWAEWRINLMARLWGEGFLLPGGTNFVSELTKPLSLGSKTTILVLVLPGFSRETFTLIRPFRPRM